MNFVSLCLTPGNRIGPVVSIFKLEIKMEIICFSETLVTTYKCTWLYINFNTSQSFVRNGHTSSQSFTEADRINLVYSMFLGVS